jgi:S-DNA-T family DNA segregation ATPase FtsK/SpoIIIE
MPHILIAGATGSGKSVCINSVIVSLLYQNSPDELKLIMVDPKRVELTVYNGVPHLLTPVITDVEKTINALKWAVAEMDRRYELLSHEGKRNLESYNASVDAVERLPYVVFIIDELADLMTVAANSVEAAIVRLAQMSRAVGIHLVLATQRPSVDVITGLIKANMPARIAFSVTSLVDSRTILDFSGAEKLLGRGDMLYIDSQLSRPKRIQGAFLDDQEIERLVAYLRNYGEPQYNSDVIEKVKGGSNGLGGDGGDMGGGESDELLSEARRVIVAAGKASASLLQRRLRIGYARAARILDILEEQGVIGPADGAKPREILLTEEEIGDVPDDVIIDDESDNADSADAEEDSDEDTKNA